MPWPKKILHTLKSMRTQVLLVVVLTGIVPVIIFSNVIMNSYRNRALRQQQDEVRNQGRKIVNYLISSNYITVAQGEAGTTPIDTSLVDTRIKQVAEVYNGRIIVVDTVCHIIKDTFDGLEEGMTIVSKEVLSGLRGKESTYVDNKKFFLEYTIPITNSSGEILGTMVMNVSTQNIHKAVEEIRTVAGIIFLSLFIVVLTVAVIYSHFLVLPFRVFSRTLDHMTEGYMAQLELKSYSELDMIADSFNHVLGQLQKLEDSRQEFVSNVSHELKTPITSMKVLADSLLGQEEVPAELYREFLVDINDEIERENKIITDLLSLVKMDKTSSELNIESVSINDLLDVILKRIHPIADKRNIELIYESFRPVSAEVDEVKLSLAINNIIENAVKYNYDGGWVKVSLNADHKYFYIKVSDSGVGIPEDAQDNIFERFYRVDKARSRDTGGTGLGLAITRNAILLHRGAIKVYSKEQEGTTFTVRIPLSKIA